MDDQPTDVSGLDLLYLIRAYNRREISLEEWIRLTRAWAEAMGRQHKVGANCHPLLPLRTPAAPD